MLLYFNTSYVTVQRHSEYADAYSEWNFNTSYVTVQQREIVVMFVASCHFNTSYVTVQRGISCHVFALDRGFQYILCYGSTLTKLGGCVIYTISIHPMLRFNLFGGNNNA
mgnify:CR=1 FL=1